jgi:hypothetical protein
MLFTTCWPATFACCAIKVATGKINATSGEAWSPGLSGDQQDYMVAPEQPWLDGYSDAKAVGGSPILSKLKSVSTMGKETGDVPLPENTSVEPGNVIELRAELKESQVREGAF